MPPQPVWRLLTAGQRTMIVAKIYAEAINKAAGKAFRHGTLADS